MMKQPPRQRPRKDEREMAIEKEARSYALEGMIVATQILTLICVIKHNPAWKAGWRCFLSAVRQNFGACISSMTKRITGRRIKRLAFSWHWSARFCMAGLQ